MTVIATFHLVLGSTLLLRLFLIDRSYRERWRYPVPAGQRFLDDKHQGAIQQSNLTLRSPYVLKRKVDFTDGTKGTDKGAVVCEEDGTLDILQCGSDIYIGETPEVAQT